MSLLLIPPTNGTDIHASATWQAAADGIFFAADSQAHRPTGLVAKLNSIHSYKPHDSDLVGSSWGDQSIHTIPSAGLVLTRLNMAQFTCRERSITMLCRN